jgi:hypothetical protein
VIEIICSAKQEFLDLSLANEPLCIILEPYSGKLLMDLNLKETSQLKVLSIHSESIESSFLKPSYCSSVSDIASLSSLVFIRQENEFIIFFCLSYHDQKISLSGALNGLTLHAKSGKSLYSKSNRPALIIVRGVNLHEAIELTMKLALSITGETGNLSKGKTILPEWLQTLGWESGSGLKLDVSHEKIVQSVASLQRTGCKIGYVLIDEGWQQLENFKLESFEADQKRFPFGLKKLIDELQLMGIKHIGVYHGMMGSRGGIHENLSRKYGLKQDASKCYFLGQDLGNTFEFFYDYYANLKAQGVTFIKVGDQSSPLSCVETDGDVTSVYKNLQSAIQASASIQFNSAIFNTDCILNENLYYWTTSTIARVAEDMDLTNSANLMCTIRNNLVNSLWVQHLMLPDFDAWTTTDKNSEILSILHALSGSVNVISDPEGEHNDNLIKKMVLPCGKILKADLPLRLCNESVFCNPVIEKKIYKAFTFKGEVGIIAAFNLVEEKCTLHGFVSPSDIEGLTGERFALLSHHKGFIGCFNYQDKIEITLKFKGADVLTFAPVKNGLAVLGCYNFLLTPGPITEINIDEDSMHISTLAASPMMIYCEREIFEVRRNGHAIPWEYNEKRKILCLDSRSNHMNEHSVYTIVFE